MNYIADIFNKPVIGRFDVNILPNRSDIILRFNIHQSNTDLRDIRADVAIVVSAVAAGLSNNSDDEQTRCSVWRRAGVDYLTPQNDTSIPYGNITGFKMRTSVNFKNGDKVVFYANKVKYYATCELLYCVSGDPVCYVVGINSYDSNKTGLLDLLETLHFDKMTAVKQPEPEVKPEVKPINTRNAYKIDIEIKPLIYRGIECWEIPAKLSSNIKVTIDKPIDPTWKLCAFNSNNSLNYIVPTTYKGEECCFGVSYGHRKFWLVDANDNNITFNITKVELI